MLYLLCNFVYLKSCIYIIKNICKLIYGNKFFFLGFKINLIFVEDVFNLREEIWLVVKIVNIWWDGEYIFKLIIKKIWLKIIKNKYGYGVN